MWISAFRPKTLTAALIPVICATALVKAFDFDIKWWVTLCALFSAISIQIGTNLINDAMDFKKGADTSERIGPKRITAQGLVKPKIVLFFGGLAFVIALLLGVPLAFEGGVPIIIIGVLSIICGYAYTAGPFPLAYRGLGDIFVVLFFGLVAVCGVFFLHTKVWSPAAFVAGLQIGFLATVLIAINNLRDIAGDTKAGKKTLAVRLGTRFVRQEIIFLITSSFVLNIFWWDNGFRWAAVLPLLTLPLGIFIAFQVVRTDPSERYNKFLGQSAGLHLLFGILLSLGLIIK
jgi:1,4-dihydroxy-2-naphthoate octaprenyltransferase